MYISTVYSWMAQLSTPRQSAPLLSKRPGTPQHQERLRMVRITRLSFDEGMHVDLPRRGLFDDDDVAADDDSAPIAPARPRKKRKRRHPDDRRPDRRQRPEGEWPRPQSPREGDRGS